MSNKNPAIAIAALIILTLACNLGAQPPVTPVGKTDVLTEVSGSLISDPYMAITGPMEMVYDWATDRCAPDDDPDMPVRAFVDADGNVQMNRSWPNNRRFVGANLDSIRPQCEITLASAEDPDPAHFNYKTWIQALYTEDGKTIYAILHNEHNCSDVGKEFCWYQNMTFAVSTDGGATFQIPSPPDNYVASLPYRFEPGVGVYGMIGGSNIIKGSDGAYYMLALQKAYKKQEQHTCLLRSEDIADLKSWRAWDGSGFNIRFVNPYVETDFQPVEHECPAVDDNSQLDGLNESLIYDTYLERYVVAAFGSSNIDGEVVKGLYYSTSKDMIHWEPKKLLAKMNLGGGPGTPDGFAYAVLLDPDSGTRNFETADKKAYIYFNRGNHASGIASTDADLARFPVEFFASEEEARAADVRTTLDLAQEPQGENETISGLLMDESGNPVSGAKIDLSWSPNDTVGSPYVYTVTTTVPDNATGGIVGFRVNEDCTCKGRSDFYIYDYSYTEADGVNHVRNSKFSNGLSNYSKWGSGEATVETSDQGSGKMLHVSSNPEQYISMISSAFDVTPGAAFTFSVNSRVVPGSFGSGFFGLFFTADRGAEALRVTIPFTTPAESVGSVNTGEDGRFEFVWKNPPAIAYAVNAKYTGDEHYWPSTNVVWSEGSVQAMAVNITKDSNVTVPANAPVNLTFSWAAKTSDQVQEFLNNAVLEVQLDGKPLPNTMDYWGEISQSSSVGGGSPLFASNWEYPLGVLEPGQHRVDISLNVKNTVTDGFADYSGTILTKKVSIEVK